MRYFVDMTSKFGFNDGESVPEGVEIYRDLYVRTINRIAELIGADQRAVPYNRPGVHNWCLILFFDKENLPPASESATWQWQPDWQTAEPDAQMQEIIDAANSLSLDEEFVEVTVVEREGFDEFLEKLDVRHLAREEG